MIKSIIFDADNTLYDVRKTKAYKKKFEFLAKKTGLEEAKIESAWRNIVGKIAASKNPKKRSREYSVEKSLTSLGVNRNEARKLAKASLKIFWQRLVKDLYVPAGTRKAIRILSRRYTLAIASDEFRDNLKKKLGKVVSDRDKYFKFLVTPETTGIMKPSAKYYKIALKRLGLKPDEVLVVGDSVERDLKPAESVGMNTLLIEDVEDLHKKLSKFEKRNPPTQ